MAARKAGIVAASGITYAASVYVAFCYFNSNDESNNKKNKLNSSVTESQSVFSYVNDPLRYQTFQKIAYAYDDEIGKDEFVMGIHLLRRALLYFHAKGDVLEVGAGTARNLPYYPNSKTVKKVVMTDISDKMLHQAKLKLKSNSNDDRFETAVVDAAHLQYPDNSFDTIVDTFGLCSFEDPVKVLRELQRVCRPNGKILLLEHGTTKSWKGLAGYLDKYAERHAKNWGCVWNRDIQQIVKDAGLVVETMDTWHFGTTYYIVCKPGTESNNALKTVNNENNVVATCACKHKH